MGKTFPASPAHAHPQFRVSGKRPIKWLGSKQFYFYRYVFPCTIMKLWSTRKTACYVAVKYAQRHSRRQWITSMFSPTTTFPVMISRWFIVIALCVGSIMRYVCMSISLKKMQFILHHLILKPHVFWSHRRLQYLETNDVIENNIGWNRNGYLRMHSNTQTCIEKRKSECGAHISKCVKPTCAYLPLIL